MEKFILTDHEIRENLFPLTLTRSAADIRVGILTIREKWELLLGKPVEVSDGQQASDGTGELFSANIIPSRRFIRSLSDRQAGEDPDWSAVKILQFPWNIFQWNDWALREDFRLLTDGRKSAAIPSTVQTVNAANIFIEAGATLSYCIINAESGPVYIGKDAEIMEGATIRGPFALCERSVVKMGAAIYGATTIGPQCVVGGEIKNSVFFGYSNKAHEGYLGDSVVAEWCNLGGGTSNSNIKNNAGEIRMYDHSTRGLAATGLRKCGLIMGDYSRAAINTSFNTGTVVGVSANVFGQGLTPKYIPSFSWGADGLQRYTFDRALVDISNWKQLKNASLSEEEKQRLKLIFDEN